MSQPCKSKSEDPSREKHICKSPKAGKSWVVEEVPGDPCVGALRTHAESLRGDEERGWAHGGPTSRCPSSQASALHGLFPLP